MHICHHFWVGATANPPKSDDRYAQLTRGAFIINDFLQNPHFICTDRLNLNNVLLANLLYLVEVYIGYASHNNDDIVRNIIARVGHFFFEKRF